MTNISNDPVMTALVDSLNFVSTTKQKIEYTKYAGPVEDMPLQSWMVNTQPSLKIVTYTTTGFETENIANVGDVIISGIFGEQYVLTMAKFKKNYVPYFVDGSVIPEQSARQVAEVKLTKSLVFQAPWGGNMVLNSDDFLVKEDDGKVYRIDRQEFLNTYNWA